MKDKEITAAIEAFKKGQEERRDEQRVESGRPQQAKTATKVKKKGTGFVDSDDSATEGDEEPKAKKTKKA